jgi:rod shape-determining protein MreD
MRQTGEVALGITLAVVLHAVLGWISPAAVVVFNAFAWVVLYYALSRHEVFGAVLGTVCGLLQDSLSLGIFGVSGLTKTLLGFGAGFISRKINVAPVTRNFIFVLVMATTELVLWKFLVFFLFREKWAAGGLIFLQPLSTALVVTLIFQARRKALRENP